MKHRFLCNHVYSSLKTYDIYYEPLGLHRILSILRIHVYIYIYIYLFKYKRIYDIRVEQTTYQQVQEFFNQQYVVEII